MRLRLAVLCPMLASALLITPVQRPAVRLALSATPRSVAPVLALPTTATLVATSTIPTLLGFYKSEYGVSYAYGAAMAAAGAMHLSAASPLAAAHAFVVLAYGVRLNLFLLYRELAIPRFRAFREKIEERAVSRGGRLARTPFVLSCSMLYFCMASPVLLTARYAPAAGTAAASALAGLVGLMALGFGVAAVGDLSKTWLKSQLGEDHLVTSGLFRWLRHPNYTGEFLLWTANAAAAAAALAGAAMGPLAKAGWLLGALIGAAGICFVLMGAAGNLEAKQAERYGSDPAYDDWVAGSWAGPALRKTPAVEEVERARKLTAAAEAAAADAAAAAEGTGAAE